MFSLFRNVGPVIEKIGEFLSLIDESSLVFKKAIRNYLDGDLEEFTRNLELVSGMERKADELRRAVDEALYLHSLLPDFRGDVMHLLESLDDLIDIAKEDLQQFDVEMPFIPPEIHMDFLELTNLSVKSVESVVMAARTFFRDPKAAAEMLQQVYIIEKEADNTENSIKRKVFRELKELHLAQKNHIRHFVNHIGNLSDISEGIADTLAIMAIRRST
jgi:predicted phosphate transport protein (TIGR00153 family)